MDPSNPRLDKDEKNLGQPELLRIMIERFRIEDIAESILAAGYKPFDPLIGYRKGKKVVIREGNRRTTALKLLLDPTLAPDSEKSAWVERGLRVSPEIREQIKEVEVTVFADPLAEDVEAYMGFRHVTGVLQWPPEEKAKFVAYLIGRHGWGYKEIADRLGSYARHVEKLYVAYQFMRQADTDEVPGADQVTIGTLLRALQSSDIRMFLGVEYPEDPKLSQRPVPDAKAKELQEFVLWAFGTSEAEPILKDSRDLTKLGKVLTAPEAVRYLRSASRPTLARAWFKSGGQKESLIEALYAAADRLEESAALTPQHAEGAEDASPEVTSALDRCGLYLAQILRDFPSLLSRHFGKR